MKPANGAVRPMISAGTVSTIGTRTSTPGVAAKAHLEVAGDRQRGTDPHDRPFRHRAERTSCAVRTAATCSWRACPGDAELESAYADAGERRLRRRRGRPARDRAADARPLSKPTPAPRRDPRPRLLGGVPARRGARARLVSNRSASSPAQFASPYARERLRLDVRTDDLVHRADARTPLRRRRLGDVIEHSRAPARRSTASAKLLAPRRRRLVLSLPDAGSSRGQDRSARAGGR